MRFFLTTSIAALVALAAAVPHSSVRRNGTAIPITKHSRLVNADNSINLDAVKAHVASVKAKILRGLDNFEKNTGMVHTSLVERVGKRGVGINLADGNHVWYGALAVGTPPFYVHVQLDTGSGDLLVPVVTCDSSCNGDVRWDPESSSTAQDIGQSFTIPYDDGSAVSGEEYIDSVVIATFTAASQTFGAVTSYPSEFQHSQSPADGVMGMGFSAISLLAGSPVFQTLVSEGQVTDSVFSFKLTASGAQLYVGGSNPVLYTGDFSYASVTRQAYWQVNMDDIQSNGQTILSNIEAVIDTGAAFIFGTPPDVAKLHVALGGAMAPSVGQGYYTFPCNAIPSISLTFGGTSFPISSSALSLGPISPGSADCVSSIVGQDWSTSLWIVGGTFLQGVYTAFDVGNSRVGFAQLA